MTAASKPMRLCRVVTVPLTFQTLLREQLRCIVAHRIDLTLVADPGAELDAVAADVGAAVASVPMRRQPAPFVDLLAAVRLSRVLSRNRFDIVHSSTPKAGLLTALAGTLARVPVRLHTFTGQPWIELTGVRRQIPRMCDGLVARLATNCYADSQSQKEFLVREGLVPSDKIAVLGFGSISGVDLARFSRATWGGPMSALTRRELGIPGAAPVIVFVGRVTRDKGICELLSAFGLVSQKIPDAHLMLVGPFEPERDPLPPETADRLRRHGRVRVVGFSPNPEKYLAAADIFCLPSYREGFGSVVIEAAAMGLPAVVTRVTGLVDAVVDGETGLVVPPKDSPALASALEHLLLAGPQRRAMGEAARLRASRDFSSHSVNEAVVEEYFRKRHRSRGP